MDTPEKNRISAVSFRNFEDSPVFQYINDLSPIETVKAASRSDNILHTFAFTSPSSLFASPQINRDSRFSIKRHRSVDLPSPVVLAESVRKSPDVGEAIKISGLCAEQLKCRSVQMENVSETKPFKEHIGLAIELANSLKNQRDGCDIEMVSSDEALMDIENGIGRAGSVNQSDELSRQSSDPFEFIADSDVVLETDEMEAEIRSDLPDIQNIEQQDPKITDPRFHSPASEPQQFSLCSNNSWNVEDRGGSCSVQVSAGAPDITLCSASNIIAFDSTAKAEDKHETGLQLCRKQRSVRRRCLTYDVGVPYKKIPLRDSTNDLPLDFTSVIKVHSPQKCVGSSKQDTEGIDPLPRKIGLHLNCLVNPSVSCDSTKVFFKDGRVLPYGPTTSPRSIEDKFSTPFSMKRDLVSCDNEIKEKASEISIEGESFDNDIPTEDRTFSQTLDESSSCKRCKCRKSKCLKLYCDCFAAGLYCVDPCSCQNCFNKPIHEDLVMETRKAIETRNPLAFASKVVSTSDSAIGFGDENSKTPASARHVRGCNCKKSGCLKKYCECYMMEVGCSSSCRCVGCKNVFGYTKEQFHFPYSGTVNDEAKGNEDNGEDASQNEEIEGRNQMLLLSSVTLASL